MVRLCTGRWKREEGCGCSPGGSLSIVFETGSVARVPRPSSRVPPPASLLPLPAHRLALNLTRMTTSRPSSPIPLPANHGSHASEELVDPLPTLERAVADRPDDAKALVAL